MHKRVSLQLRWTGYKYIHVDKTFHNTSVKFPKDFQRHQERYCLLLNRSEVVVCRLCDLEILLTARCVIIEKKAAL